MLRGVVYAHWGMNWSHFKRWEIVTAKQYFKFGLEWMYYYTPCTYGGLPFVLSDLLYFAPT